jgi:6,7-dimethyl-8-ribityllumazine synthase
MAQSQDSPALLDTSELLLSPHPRVAVIYTEWNQQIIQALRAGCEEVCTTLQGHITHNIAVPGSFELPFACRQLWQHVGGRSGAPEAIIAFGAVIRGGTPHFDYVCKAVTEGILQLNLELPVPVIFGVLTLDNEQQAWERLGGAHGHKGREAAITAFKMIKAMRQLNAS